MVMAVGIGLSVYLFSFLNTMAYKDLPFKDADTLLVIDQVQNGTSLNGGNLDLHDFHELRTNVKGFKEVSTFSEINVNVSGRDGARRYNATEIEPNFFHMTRTKPEIGREITNAENLVGANNVILIGHDIWQNQFGGSTDVLEKTLRINGNNHNIIGVMPQGYFFPRNSEIWMPMRQDATKLERGRAGNIAGLVHRDKDVSDESISAQMDLVMKRLEKKYPKTNNGIGAYATTFPMSTMGNGSGAFLFAMYMAAVLLLLLASINVGNLLLSRAVERGKETAVRVALGAPRSRLIGQMMWESIIICCVGGLIGLLVAAWGLEVTASITATFTDDKPFFWWTFGVDSYTLKIFFGFVIGTILITGLLPAWKNSNSDFNAVLRDGTRGALGKKSGRLNRILVISEVFLSMTILIAAAVMVIGTYMSTQADYGADTENTLTARVRLVESNYGTREKRAQFAQTLQTRLENTPGIGDVMITSALPGDYTWRPTIAVEGVEYIDENSYSRANYIVHTPGTLSKLGVKLIQGRYFNSSDDGLEKRTTIVSESFAKRHFDGEPAIGKRIRVAEVDGDTPNWLTVVGVVEHTIQGQALGQTVKNTSIYRSVTQAPRFSLRVAMRMTAEQTVAVRSLRQTLASIDPDLPAFIIKTYDERIERNSAGMGFAAKMFLMFGIVAVILASTGIYGVMSNTINQRTQEIGIRRALGANDQRITRDYLMTGFKQLLWGGIPGLLAGGGIGFAMSQLLSTENSTLVTIAMVMTTLIGFVVMLSTYLPTKRALKMEPSEALHYE